jgi:hypothetical protein
MEERMKNQMRRDARCRHFTGIQNNICEGGLEYPTTDLPCWGEHQCGKYSPLTAEELAEKEAQLKRHMELMRQGLSGCCEAPFDTSHVLTSGRFKGHGPRYCSKCKALCFVV